MHHSVTLIPRSRLRLAWWLALAAVLAQLALAPASTAQHARMLADLGMGDICTAAGVVRGPHRHTAPSRPDPEHARGDLHCAICAVVAHIALPAAPAGRLPRAEPPALVLPALDAGIRLAAVFTLRPPPRAPPLPA